MKRFITIYYCALALLILVGVSIGNTVFIVNVLWLWFAAYYLMVKQRLPKKFGLYAILIFLAPFIVYQLFCLVIQHFLMDSSFAYYLLIIFLLLIIVASIRIARSGSVNRATDNKPKINERTFKSPVSVNNRNSYEPGN